MVLLGHIWWARFYVISRSISVFICVCDKIRHFVCTYSFASVISRTGYVFVLFEEGHMMYRKCLELKQK